MRRLTILFVWLALAAPLEAAVAINTSGNNGANNGGTTTSVSWSFDPCSAGPAGALMVQIEGDTSTDDLLDVSVSGTSITILGKAHATNGRWTYAAGQLTPTCGAQTITATSSTVHYLFGVAVSYSGVVGFGAVSTATGSSITQLTGSITTTAANSWVYLGASGSNVSTWAGVTNATLRGQYVPFSSPAVFDNNASIAAGSYSMTVGTGISGDIGLVMVELRSTSTGSTITVCASGCTFPNGSLQAALDSAAPGDTVMLQGGQLYASGTDGYVLGAQCHAVKRRRCILVRTGVTAVGAIMPDSAFPGPGMRMPAGPYRGTLAKLIPSVNNSPAIRTIFPNETGPTCSVAPCVADGWSLQFLEFGPKVDWAVQPIVAFGSNKAAKEFNSAICTYPDANPACWVVSAPGGDTQDMLVEFPQYLEFIQNDLHGDAFVGQHKGILVVAKDAWILNNSITDIKSRQESQAIANDKGLGPTDIENNLLEATTENFMSGGADTYLQLQATISGSPTTTTIVLSSPVWMHPELTTTAANLSTDIFSGEYVSITHAGTTYAGMTCTMSGSTCTLSPAMPVTPSVGDVVRWSWTTGGLTFEKNWDRKQASWMGPAIPTPTGLIATPGTGGSLSAGSHCYAYIEWALISGETDAYSSPSAEVCATTGAGGKVTLTWPSEAHATHYWVYGNGPTGTESQYWNVTSPTYVDTGAAGSAGNTNFEGMGWLVKNGFELKGCDGVSPMGPCRVQGNVIDRNWCCTQNATVTLKVHNQAGNEISNNLRNLTFRDNWIRHGNRCLALVTSSVTDENGNEAQSGAMVDVLVTNNLCTDITTTYEYPHAGGTVTNSAILVTAGQYPHDVSNRGCTRCTITHNSLFVNTNVMPGPVWFNFHGTDKMTDFVMRDNIQGRDCTDAGCVSDGNASLKAYIDDINQGLGTPSWTAITAGSSFADHNAWPDGGVGTYTAGPFTSPFFFPDATIKASHLTAYTNCDVDTDILGCGLRATSSMHNAASDGTDVGANMAVIKAFTDIALSGDPGGGADAGHPSGATRMRMHIRF